ncbi:MAG: DUF2520 domain-containing protein [Pyrinomonadaceae bacterium]|nr:DUF2520 domain-containing protein [Pyrinomonadaceae bacterium]MCX7640963.1 DUF2520 domain-containing protein [Pyrinomonadaceae bacterium]MDW8305114.1 DUF2520 domain-containing protein [Acidobacteriota bacterium]
MKKISIIGIGRMGGALALALSKKGYTIEQLISKNLKNAEIIAEKLNNKPEILSYSKLEKVNSSDVVFITTQDDRITEVAVALSQKISPGKIVFHTSGSLSSQVLSVLKGCYKASLHPLISVSNPFTGSENLKNAFFCLEGDEKAVELGKRIVFDLEGQFFFVRTEDKPLYHAAAVITAGHLVALFQVAVKLLSKCGISEPEAQKIFLPLAKSVIKNLETQPPEKALTGTFARADVETMKQHLRAIKQKKLDDVLEIYSKLGLISLELSQKVNPDLKEQIEKMKAEITDFLSKK